MLERLFWIALAAWCLAVVFWRPEPPISYAQVPSVVPYPDGYRIFYELVKEQTRQVNRSLRKVSALDAEVDVLVILSPSRGIPLKEREALAEWIRDGGNTLVVGYPVRGEDGQTLSSIIPDASGEGISTWEAKDPSVNQYTFTAAPSFSARKVPDFNSRTAGVLVRPADAADADDDDASIPLVQNAKDGTWLIAVEAFGAGRLIQIADSRVMGNEAIGFKQTHLLSAALLDGIGRDRLWSFDESHEGVSVQPALAPLVGASRFRLLFLYVVLLVIFGYWWWSSRLGRPVPAPDTRRIGDVTTLARDIGDFYFRAKKSRWALEQSARYFRYFLGNRALSPQDRMAGLALAKEVDAALASAGDDVGRDTALIRAMTERMGSLSAKE